MRTSIGCAVLFVAALLVACQAVAQEVVPAPEPGGGARVEAAPARTGAATLNRPRQLTPRPIRMRIVGATAGRTAAGGTGHRRTAGCGTATRGSGLSTPRTVPRPPVASSPELPAYSYPQPRLDYYGAYYPGYVYPGFVYPGYGYYRGYYPGVAVGVWPYGNVGVVCRAASCSRRRWDRAERCVSAESMSAGELDEDRPRDATLLLASGISRCRRAVCAGRQGRFALHDPGEDSGRPEGTDVAAGLGEAIPRSVCRRFGDV